MCTVSHQDHDVTELDRANSIVIILVFICNHCPLIDQFLDLVCDQPGFILSGGQTSKLLSEEHESAKREAGAAYARARAQAESERIMHTYSNRGRGGGLLDLLFDILG